ncbi:MAG: hypothetical protein V9F82_10295 [Dermatophilaceae bacterium]
MKTTIAKIFEAMLTKDATPTWGGSALAVPAPERMWGWDPR